MSVCLSAYSTKPLPAPHLVDLEESEEVGQRVDDHGAQLDGHEGGHAGEELLHQLRGVTVVGRHQVLPALLLVNEQLGACWDPAGNSMGRRCKN